MRFTKILLYGILPNLLVAKFVPTSYCCLACKKKHVMCQFPDKYQIGPLCKDYRRIDLDPEKVLDLCNRIKSVKAIYAGGTNPRKMDWDYELQEIAQRWANQCPNKSDECRDTARGKVSQIVDSIGNEQFVSPTWESVFLKWYLSPIGRNVMQDFTSGHWNALSQLIWSSTVLIGCAASSHLTETGRLVTIVCNFSPPGNIKGQAIFDMSGGMCTKCPKGTSCSDSQNVNLCVIEEGHRLETSNVLVIFLVYLNSNILIRNMKYFIRNRMN